MHPHGFQGNTALLALAGSPLKSYFHQTLDLMQEKILRFPMSKYCRKEKGDLKKPVCFSLDAKEMAQLNAHELRKSISTSDIIRVAIHEFLDRESEKENKNKEK